tara:strand:+ start:3227 stop:3607 length:381 start_codon:yes stop_codon:yes gene_type:complete
MSDRNAEYKYPAGGFPPDHPHKTPPAAKRIGSSPSKLTKLRMTDAVRIAEGEEPVGPVWCTDDNGYIFYLEKDLVEWLRKNIRRVTEAVPAFKKRSPYVAPELRQSRKPDNPDNPDSAGDSPQSAA